MMLAPADLDGSGFPLTCELCHQPTDELVRIAIVSAPHWLLCVPCTEAGKRATRSGNRSPLFDMRAEALTDGEPGVVQSIDRLLRSLA